MNLDSPNNWLMLAANIGVIGGIIFLAFEVRQNNLMMRSQTRSDISQNISNMLMQWGDSEYVDLTLLDINLADLDTEEFRRVFFFYTAQFRTWENIHYQYRNGLYDESEFTKEREVWRQTMNTDATKAMFCRDAHVYSDEFVNEMYLLMEAPCN